MLYKFNLEEVESSLNIKLKRNTSVLGVDVAQNKSGFCLLNTDEKNICVDYLDLLSIKKENNSTHKMIDLFIIEGINIREKIENIKTNKTKILIIEDSWFNKSVWVTKILSKFATVVYLLFKKWATIKNDPIQAIHARKLVGFKKDKDSKLSIKDQIKNWIEDQFNLTLEDDNHADAFILALSGLVESV